MFWNQQERKIISHEYRNNHYVPQFYLNYWSDSSNKIWSYRKLVPYPNWKIWEHDGVKKYATLPNFYTELNYKKEANHILERIFSNSIEHKISTIYKQVIDDRFIIDYEKKHDFIKYIIIQFLRTPSGYIRLRDEYCNIVESASKEVIRDILNNSNNSTNVLNTSNIDFAVKGKINDDKLHLTTIFDRKAYLDYLKHIIDDEVISNIVNQDWIILRPPKNLRFPTSDNPVIVYKKHPFYIYSFNTFPGNRNAEIIFPLNPDCVLYTKIGKNLSKKNFTRISSIEYDFICMLISENAYTSVFSDHPRIDILKYSPRIIDKFLYLQQYNSMKDWFKYNNNIEEEFSPRVNIE